MTPAAKALWYLESHFAEPITLDDVAAVGCVSRFHMARAFSCATGCSVMGYLRARRLSVAAVALASGAGDILAVALDAGYGSHEAFTRAFREYFGVTPEQVRGRGDTNNLKLMEPIRMQEQSEANVSPPRMETAGPMRIAGICQRYSGDVAGIPSQWQKFVPWIGTMPGQVGFASYGLCMGTDESMDYICGVEVVDGAVIPAELSEFRLLRQKYAVFTHRGHISGIGATWSSIFNRGLQESGLKMKRAAQFERYGVEFDGATGMGDVEIWIPVEE